MVDGRVILLSVFAVIILAVIIILIMYLIAKSKGRLEIKVDKYNFSPGENITGKLNIVINGIVKAKELNIRLVGEKIHSNSRRNSQNSSYIYDFKLTLDGEKEYEPGTDTSYDFNIKIPENVLSTIDTSGIIGTIVNTSNFISGTNTYFRWYLIGNLEIPGINISKKVQINIA